MLGGEGTPMSDHRASANYRAAMLRTSLLKFFAANPARRVSAGVERMSHQAHGPLADRPINPKVGLEISHESAALHVTGAALYTEDLVEPDQGRAARLAAAGAARPRPGHPARSRAPRTPFPGWSRC